MNRRLQGLALGFGALVYALIVHQSNRLIAARLLGRTIYFANFFTLSLVAALFIKEYIVRKRVLPHMQHVSVFVGIRVFLLAPKTVQSLRR